MLLRNWLRPNTSSQIKRAWALIRSSRCKKKEPEGEQRARAPPDCVKMLDNPACLRLKIVTQAAQCWAGWCASPFPHTHVKLHLSPVKGRIHIHALHPPGKCHQSGASASFASKCRRACPSPLLRYCYTLPEHSISSIKHIRSIHKCCQLQQKLPVLRHLAQQPRGLAHGLYKGLF